MHTQNNQNLQNTAVILVIEIWYCFLYASSSDCDLSWRLKCLHNTRVVVQNFKISKIRNLFVCSTTGAYPGIYKGVGYLKPFQQGRIYFYCAKGKQVHSLAGITSVFRPKSSEEQTKRSSRPQIVHYTHSLSLLHYESFVHLSAGRGGRPWAFTLHKRPSYATAVQWNLSRHFSDVGYTINGRVLNNWNRILLKLQ